MYPVPILMFKIKNQKEKDNDISTIVSYKGATSLSNKTKDKGRDGFGFSVISFFLKLLVNRTADVREIVWIGRLHRTAKLLEMSIRIKTNG
jgi:hypothetical protein